MIEEKENTAVEGQEKFPEGADYRIIIHTPERDYACYLKEPDFDVYANALIAMQKPSGKIDRLGAGRFVLQVCWVAGDPEIKKVARLEATAAFDAAGLVDIFQAEIKKK